MPMTQKFEGDPPVNEVTWLELIQRTWSLLVKFKKVVITLN
jgi:hypothetical protein